MKRRLILISAAVLIILLIFIAFIIKRKEMPLPVKEGGPTQVTAISLPALVNQAKDLEAKGDLLGTKNTYQTLINEFPSSNEIMNWQKKIESLNIKLLFSALITPNSMLYTIKPGDTLNKIAKEFKTTPDLIKKSNSLRDDKILPGRKIKVWTAPFSIAVDKSQNILLLKVNEEVFKTYIVSTGKNNSTPTGNFEIVNKLVNPTWFKAGTVVPAGSPENILGSHWLGFDLAGYGLHGTTDPQSLGKQVTEGCVRLSNSEAEELYTILRVGTEVTIVD